MAEYAINGWWIFVILGVLGGIISGSLGVGSGALLVPALVIMFAYPQKSAQGTALAVMVPMALVGAIRYKLNPDIDINYTNAILIAIGSLVGVVIGAELMAKLPASVLRKAFAIFLMIVAVKMLTMKGKKKEVVDKEPLPVENIK